MYLTLQAVYYTLWTEIDSNRLRREIDSVQANRLSKHSAEKPWDSTFLKYSKDSSDLVLNSSHLKNADHLLLPHASLLTAINPVNTEAYQLDQNTADTRFIAKSEPEYDHRWLTIRQSHTYNYLPNSLCQHEQAEGTVLAVAVVVPKPDALENQKKLYEWEVSNRVDRLDSQDSFRQKRNDERSCFLQVPLPASSSLIRLWLNELQSKNPCFNNATLVIRVPMNVESRTTPNMDGDITSDNDLHTEDNQNDLKTQKSYN
ncbi:unnamed protein product [Heterobilharzia americana]|nr:unnamed protein product [Heterobilharzia americana]